MIESQYLPEILDNHQFQGKSNDCGPISAVMVINSLLGLSLDGKTLGKEMAVPIWDGLLPNIKRIPNWATLPWGMVDIFKEYGLSSTWKIFQNTNYLKNGITGGRIILPIIGSIIPLWAHIMILLSYDPERGWGFANPASKFDKIYWIKEEKFRKLWFAMGNTVIVAAPI